MIAETFKILLASFLLLGELLFFPKALLAAQSISVNDFAFGVVGETEFLAGYAILSNQPILWESDVPWRITVRSLDANLGMSNSGEYIKPLSDLEWKLSGESGWTPMTQDDTEVDWSEETGSGAIYIDVRVLLEWAYDEPGTYQADLLFTISAL